MHLLIAAYHLWLLMVKQRNMHCISLLACLPVSEGGRKPGVREQK